MAKPPDPDQRDSSERDPALPDTIGNRIAPARFLVFLALFALGTALASGWLTIGQAAMAGFDFAAIVFLLSLQSLFDDEAQAMRDRARATDANRAVLLVITGLTMLVILVAVAVELSGKPAPSSIALVIVTLVLAWLFSNTVYALHYAHLFYSDKGADSGDDGGLAFPGTDEPDYWDFVYFAYTLGMTFQTSDVEIEDNHVRRVVTGHCLAAFVFNLGVLAFTINVLGG